MNDQARVLKLVVAYDGGRFVGWQRQAEGVSIQALLEEALAALEGGEVAVHGAGRTDAGVHAEGQVASARVTFRHGAATVLRAVNARLPEDVRVLAVQEAAPDFHARFSARGKIYRYQIANTAVASPFTRAYAWHVPEPLDLAAMQEAAAAFVGTHDFSAFRSTGSDVATTVRTITRADVRRAGDLLLFEVAGDGFLRHMVRAMAGTLVDVGRGWRGAATVAPLLGGAGRAAAGATAPAHGLFLARVEY